MDMAYSSCRERVFDKINEQFDVITEELERIKRHVEDKYYERDDIAEEIESLLDMLM